MKQIFSGLVVSLGLMVSGCLTIPVTSLPRLSALDVMKMDYSQIKVAVRVQNGFRLEKDDVKLTIGLIEGSTGQKSEEMFFLDVDDAPLTTFLEKQRKSGFRIYRFGIAASDAERVLAFRDRLVEIKAQSNQSASGDKNSLSLSVTSKGCLERGANPFRKIRPTIYLQPAPDETFFTLIKEQSLDLPQDDEGKIEFCKS